MNKITVCIGTKGRVNTSTFKLFDNKHFKVYHFIEPKELDLYDVPNKISIEKNDMGIAYMRNFLLNWSKERNEDWVIFSDDDITNFGESVGKKTIKKDSKILLKIYEKIKQLPFEIAGMNYSQYAWSESKQYRINTGSVDCCIFVNVKKIKWKFNESLRFKSDREFIMQTIKKGYGVIKFPKIFFSCPNIGSNKGGLHDLYANRVDEESIKQLAIMWNPYVKLIKNRTNRLDGKIYYREIARDNNKHIV